MKNFIFKSTDADLHKMFTYLDTLQKNVLYLTHQVDYIRKTLAKLVHDKDLQLTVDKYFESKDVTHEENVNTEDWPEQE